MSFDPDCPLCKAEELTHRYFDDEEFWIADCLTCGVPMAVLRGHSIDPSDELILKMRGALMAIGYKLGSGIYYPPGVAWKIDYERRQIPDHWHCHLRLA